MIYNAKKVEGNETSENGHPKRVTFPAEREQSLVVDRLRMT